jgi:hypothetical protein
MAQLTNLRPPTLNEVIRLLATACGHPDEVLLIASLTLGWQSHDWLHMVQAGRSGYPVCE